MMTRETEFILTVIVLVVFGIGIAWLFLRAYLLDPARKPLKRTTPELREKHKRARMGFVPFAKWQSRVKDAEGARSPFTPYCGPHILAINNDRAVLRAAAHNYMRRLVGVSYIFIPISLISFVIPFWEAMRFFSTPIHRSYSYSVVENGEIRRATDYYDPTISDYIISRIHNYPDYFNEWTVHYYGLGRAIERFIMSDGFFLPVLLVLILLFFITILRRVDAPLVFDRRRQMVYTVHRGHLFAAPWKTVRMTVTVVARNTGLAFALEDIEGNRGKRWFPLAAWGNSWAAPGPHPNPEPFAYDRWKVTRRWLMEYMQGLDVPARTGVPQGLIALLAPREGVLPDDLESRLDQAMRGRKFA